MKFLRNCCCLNDLAGDYTKAPSERGENFSLQYLLSIFCYDFGDLPERQSLQQPRASPWVRESKIMQPEGLQVAIAALQAAIHRLPYPGRCPGLLQLLPFRQNPYILYPHSSNKNPVAQITYK